jgi:hypothetical protein
LSKHVVAFESGKQSKRQKLRGLNRTPEIPEVVFEKLLEKTISDNNRNGNTKHIGLLNK